MKSKALAATIFLLIIIALGYSFSVRTEWWMFSDIFFAFIGSFLHLLAVTMAAKLPAMRRQLELAALVCFILCLICFLLVWVIL